MKHYIKTKIRNLTKSILVPELKKALLPEVKKVLVIENKALKLELEKLLKFNIRLEAGRRALSTTVDYVESKMGGVISVNSRFKVHDKAIEHITIDGLILEFGVFQAQTLNYIAKQLPKCNIYGFDSFEGLPEYWRDGFDKSRFAVDELPKVEDNVKLIKGWFDETLPKFIETKKEKISYLHIDCDLYSSTKTIFELLGNQIVEGTVIVFDEYFNFPNWENDEYKAFQEFITKTKKEYKYLTYNYKHQQVAVLITKG